MDDRIFSARHHRLARGLTIRSLAEQAGVSTQTIVSIEKGKPARIQSFNAIAKVFGVPVMDIQEYRDAVLQQQEVSQPRTTP